MKVPGSLGLDLRDVLFSSPPTVLRIFRAEGPLGVRDPPSLLLLVADEASATLSIEERDQLEDETVHDLAFYSRENSESTSTDSRSDDHVLVFDEDDLQRRLASMQLQNLGCVFHAAESHERAIQIFEADPLIRLVLVDYGKDGTGLGELVWKIRKARETTTIVGISSGCRRREFEEIGIDRCLQKPLVSDTIRELLENCRTRA